MALQEGWRTASVYAGLGYRLDDRRFDLAKEQLGKAIELDPSLAEAYHLRAVAELYQSIDEDRALDSSAIEDIETAIALGPTTASLMQSAVFVRLQTMRDEAPATRGDVILGLLNKAVSLGLDRHAVASLNYLPEFQANPKFDALVARAPEKKQYDPMEEMIPDPVKTLPLVLPADLANGNLRGFPFAVRNMGAKSLRRE
jgi:hypothetical protein